MTHTVQIRTTGRGDLQIHELFTGHAALLRGLDGNLHLQPIQRQVGGGGGVGQGRGHRHIHLRHGDALFHGGVAVHGDVEGRGGLLQTVGHLAGTLHGFQGRRQRLGGGLEVLHVVAVDLQRDAAARQIGRHTVHGAGSRHLTGQVGAQLLDGLACLGAGGPLRHGDVGGDVIGTAGAAHHAAHIHAAAGGHHGTHGIHILHRPGTAHHLVRQCHRLLPADALRHGNGEADVIHIDLGHEHEAPADGTPRRASQQHHRQQQYHGLMAQRPAHRPAVGGIDPLQQAGLHGLFLFQHPGGHGRHQCQGHDEAGQKRIRHGQGQIGEQLLGDALHEHNGQEHAHRGQGGGGDGPHHLRRTGHRRLNDGGSLRAQPVDILDDHHGVIHQHTHCHRQTRQGDHIDGDAGEVHQHHGEDHTDGDGAEGDEGGPQVLQEQVQDQHRKQSAPAQGGQDGVNDDIDVVPLIHQRHEVQAVVLFLQRVAAGLNVVGHLRRGVGRLLVEGDDDAVVAVELGVDLIGVIRHHDLRHVGELHRLHALQTQIKEHHVRQLLTGGDAVAHGNHVVHTVLLQIPGRHGEVLSRQQGGDGLDVQSPGEVRLLQRRGTGGLQRPETLLQLGQGAVQLHIGREELGDAIGHGDDSRCYLIGNGGHLGIILQPADLLF